MTDVLFIDVDTQVDFVEPTGALYVPGSQEAMANVHQLLSFATERRITTISGIDAHVVDDPEFKQYPPHCIQGTPGQRRYFDDLPKLPRHVWPADADMTGIDLTIEKGHHYIAEKRDFPMCTNPWLQALRERGVFRRVLCVVFGVATDVCVRADVLDLCAAGAHVRVAEDAIAGIDAANTERALGEMRHAGARLVPTDELLRGL